MDKLIAVGVARQALPNCVLVYRTRCDMHQRMCGNDWDGALHAIGSSEIAACSNASMSLADTH
eukprot:14670703-Alexandrium_andersonii.AAC.1